MWQQFKILKQLFHLILCHILLIFLINDLPNIQNLFEINIPINKSSKKV